MRTGTRARSTFVLAIFVAALSLVATGSSAAESPAGAIFAKRMSAVPLGAIAVYSAGLVPGGNNCPDSIVAGPDGKLWFTDQCTSSIGQFDPKTHTVAEYFAGGPGRYSDLHGIAVGPDGNLWFTIVENGTGKPAIGQINPTTHAIAEYSTGLQIDSGPNAIVAGPDGNLWFTDDPQGGIGVPAIGTINPTTHEIAEYSAGLNPRSVPNEITMGPDGKLWFTDAALSAGHATPAIGTINPTTHEIAEYSAGLQVDSSLRGIAAGPDGNLWFVDDDHYGVPRIPAIGQINPSTHAIVEYSAGLLAGSRPDGGIAAGPDGNLWFVDGATSLSPPAIGRIDPNTHAIEEYSCHLHNLPADIVAGPRGNMWFTVSEAAIGRIGATPPPATFRLVRVSRGKARNGAATLVVRVPGAGLLTVSGKGILRRHRETRKACRAARLTLPIRARGRARRRLDRTGRATVKVKVTFAPADGGEARSRIETIELTKRLRPA